MGRVDREVRQRQVGIWVLQATAMPSVLIETGFISNPDDEKYLNSKEGQKELSECINRALKNYIGWIEKNQLLAEATGSGKPIPFNSETKKFLDMIETKERNLTK